MNWKAESKIGPEPPLALAEGLDRRRQFGRSARRTRPLEAVVRARRIWASASVRSVMSRLTPTMLTGAPSSSKKVAPRPGQPADRAVGPDDAVLDLVRDARLHRPLGGAADGVAVLGVDDGEVLREIGERPIIGPAVEELEGVLVGDAVGLDVPLPVGEPGGGEGPALALLALAQRLLGLLEPADVEVDAGPADDPAVVVPHGDAAGEDGVPPSVRAPEAVLDVPRALGPDAFLPGRDGPLGVVRVEHVPPAEFGALLLGQADEPEERLAGVGVAALGVADPHPVGDRFADRPVDPLAVAESLLGLLPLGDVAHDARVEPPIAERNSLTARSIGKVEPSRRRPSTSRPMPMIFGWPVPW